MLPEMAVIRSSMFRGIVGAKTSVQVNDAISILSTKTIGDPQAATATVQDDHKRFNGICVECGGERGSHSLVVHTVYIALP